MAFRHVKSNFLSTNIYTWRTYISMTMALGHENIDLKYVLCFIKSESTCTEKELLVLCSVLCPWCLWVAVAAAMLDVVAAATGKFAMSRWNGLKSSLQYYPCYNNTNVTILWTATLLWLSDLCLQSARL